MIYTSYYGKLRAIPEEFCRIAISRATPGGLFGELRYLPLAPSADILYEYKHTRDEEKFTKAFRSELDRLDPLSVVADLLDMAGENPDIVLLCYEKAGDFCHRHIVAEWLREHRVPVEEYGMAGGSGNDADFGEQTCLW